MSGAAIEALANNPAIEAITPDAPVRSTSTGPRSSAAVAGRGSGVELLRLALDGADDRRRGLGCRCDAGGRFRRTGRRADELRPVEQAERGGHGRVRSRHLRGEHRGGRGRGVRGRRAGREHRLARRARRHGRGLEERRAGGGGLDLREQGDVRHPGRELLAAGRLGRRASCTTRSTRRSRSSGCPASWS